ncbi:hypothetical protein OIE66_17855 [Nonomuraea sp. NBC_01738]|nr:hypothetical protein OIE66_17855 [Nonomuraea sp. NBC_01738]
MELTWPLATLGAGSGFSRAAGSGGVESLFEVVGMVACSATGPRPC